LLTSLSVLRGLAFGQGAQGFDSLIEKECGHFFVGTIEQPTRKHNQSLGFDTAIKRRAG